MLKYFFNRIYDGNADTDCIINAVQPELDALARAFRTAFDDAFPVTATENGIVEWENVLCITPDLSEETIEFRRGRILNRLSSSLPYTERALQQFMDNTMGTGGWSYVLDCDNYRLDITGLKPGRSWLAEMELTLEKIIPANIEWYLHLYYTNWEWVRDRFFDWKEMFDSGKTWRDVLESL